MVVPIYHVLANIGEFRDGEVLPIALGDGLRVQALALRNGSRARVILANMTDEPVRVALDFPGLGAATARRLDAETALLAASEPEAFRATVQPLEIAAPVVAIALPPFGLVTIDGELG
jgi:hypothetical protein